MINKLWTDVSLENYNNWYPLTGKITETPQQYINTWPNVNDWFITFAIRAQNDINAYLDFILSKFPFDSFKDELIKETLRDMVYVMVEHWVFNRTPIEFNVDATIQFNNGNQFSASSIPTINVWDLAPSRMKIWARLTELKQVFLSYNQDEIDIEKIDLQAFYTRNQVDELIKEQKEFTLSKQMKLYDDLVDDNEDEVYRGRVTNFINKSYVATEYNKETETMILDWPAEIGTLPPEALQNNPQIGDYTHAPTCDFSAKQQKRITTNENEITKLNNKLTNANERINDIKNNWFNIETSPLWKKVKNENIKTNTWYIIDWTYYFIDSKQLIISNNKLTKSNIRITNHQIQNRQIIIEKIDVNIDKVMLLYDDNSVKFIVANSTKNYTPIIHNIYQYQGNGTPTEFIAEDSTERDYYTKQETNDLLDKKQDKLIAGDNITIDKNNKISSTGGGVDPNNYYTKPEVDKKLDDKVDINKFSYAFAVNALGTENPNLETTDKTIVGGINENKTNIGKKIIGIENKTKLSSIGFHVKNKTDDIICTTLESKSTDISVNILQIGDLNKLKTENKTVVDAINELNAKSSETWKKVGTISDDKQKITYQFNQNTFYRVGYSAGTDLKTGYGSVKYITFKHISTNNEDILLDSLIDKSGTNITSWIDLVINRNGYVYLDKHNWNVGFLYDLEEGKTEETYEIRSNTLEIKKSNNIDITKPLHINSNTLNIKELSENNIDIELKENPNPCPCPKWKEVAIANESGYQINYELKNNTYYRIFYDNSIMISKPGKYPCLIKEFYWIKSDEISPSDLLVNIPCIGVSGKFESGLLLINKKRIYLQNQKQLNIWKLEELQE